MAEYQEIEGDLLDTRNNFEAIAHGCNTCGVMGAGIAAAIANKYPTILPPYRKACLNGTFKLGKVQTHITNTGLIIYNLATQIKPGRDARLEAIAVTTQKAAQDCHRRNIATLHLPRIGCGIGGLTWEDVNDVLQDIATTGETNITVVTPNLNKQKNNQTKRSQ